MTVDPDVAERLPTPGDNDQVNDPDALVMTTEGPPSTAEPCDTVMTGAVAVA